MTGAGRRGSSAAQPRHLGTWWGEPEYRVCGTFPNSWLFILRNLHVLDPARFLTVTAKLSHEQETEPQDIVKIEWKVILEPMGASQEEIKGVEVKMGKRQ